MMSKIINAGHAGIVDARSCRPFLALTGTFYEHRKFARPNRASAAHPSLNLGYTDKRTTVFEPKSRLRLDAGTGARLPSVAMIKQIKFVSIPVANQNRALD